MDVLSDVLRSVRLTGAVFFDMEAHSPWVGVTPRAEVIAGLVMPEAEHVICFHALTAGSCWVELADCSLPPLASQAGDMVIVGKGDAHFLCSTPGMRGEPDLAVYQRPADRRLAAAARSQRNHRRPGDVPFRLRLSRLRLAAVQSAARCTAAPVPRPGVRREPGLACEPPSHGGRRDRGRQGRPRDHAGQAGGAFFHRGPAEAYRRTGGRPARLVLRIAGSACRGGAAADPRQAVAGLDARRSRPRGGAFSFDLRQKVQ